MRANEFIIEMPEHDLRDIDVGGTKVQADFGDKSHLTDRKFERDVTPTSVDITLRQLPHFKKQISAMQPGQGFYLADPRLNITLGMRITDGGTLRLVTVIDRLVDFSKHYPILTIDPIHEE
jgi:hypothetical protein